MKRIIKWESQHLEIDTMSGKLDSPDEEEEYLESDDNETQQIIQSQTQNLMSTPFGLWRVDDRMNPYKQFQLWIGHTNFTISEDVVNIIKNVPGIEILKIITRYRFMIGVGELFDIRDVRTDIEKQLQCNQEEFNLIQDKDIQKAVNELQNQLSAYEKWAIYVFPNGSIDYVVSTQEDFQTQLNKYKQAIDLSKGVLIESKNVQNTIK